MLAANTKIYLYLLLLLLITIIVYSPTIKNDFVNWDDNTYVTSNPDIRHFHHDSVAIPVKKFFTSYVMGNYHPITMLCYGIEYRFFQLNPMGYHAINLFLHLINIVLVFYFIYLLSKQLKVACVTTLLFAIHPMHVESVAWVSELKDLLYTMFYVAALITYLLYVTSEKRKKLFYFFTLLLFLLSALSKGMAVSFTAMLFVVDYFLERKISKQTLPKKIPFLVISIVFGITAILAQRYSHALDIAQYNFFDRLLFSGYGLITYLWKLLIPVNLSCYYPYPDKTGGFYPIVFYIAPLVIVSFCYLFLKHRKKLGKHVIFGLLFFMVSIALVLQLLPVGSSLISERYTYIPYIGLFFIVAVWINKQLELGKKGTQRSLIIFTSIIYILFLSIQSYSRTKVWKDSIALWTDAIEKEPDYPFLYDNRASSYYVINEFDKAISDFSSAIDLGYLETKVYFKRGTVFYAMGKYKEAAGDFDIAVKENSYDSIVFYKRAYAYAQMGKYHEAITDYDRMLKINPAFSEAYHDRGLVFFYMKNYEAAIIDFTKSIELKPDYATAYLSRGSVYFTLKKIDSAIYDYSKAIDLLPEYTDAYYNRSIAYLTIGYYKESLKDALKAKELGYAVPPQLFLDIQKHIENR